MREFFQLIVTYHLTLSEIHTHTHTYIYTKNTTPSRFLLVINLVPEVKKKI